jgi:hypothetical protein
MFYSEEEVVGEWRKLHKVGHYLERCVLFNNRTMRWRMLKCSELKRIREMRDVWGCERVHVPWTARGFPGCDVLESWCASKTTWLPVSLLSAMQLHENPSCRFSQIIHEILTVLQFYMERIRFRKMQVCVPEGARLRESGKIFQVSLRVVSTAVRIQYGRGICAQRIASWTYLIT